MELSRCVISVCPPSKNGHRKASKNGNIILKGTVPDKLVVYKDSDNIIYIKYDIGIDANIFLIGSKNNRCMIKAERVELPNDAEVFIY